VRDVSREFEQEIRDKTVRTTRRDFEWVFDFGDAFTLVVGSAWRLRGSDSLLLTDADDGQKYGLPAPVDAEARSNDALADATVSSFELDDSTGDLTITFSNGVSLEVLTDSMGYESWQAYSNGELFAVGGNGGLR
jgi:uncharacterized protein DUF6188